MTSYVAGASSDAEQIAEYIDALTHAGLHVTLDWTRTLLANKASGVGDRDDGVARAEFSWLITPRAASTSAGCWVELGHAIALRKHIVVSGDHLRSIFTALVQEGER